MKFKFPFVFLFILTILNSCKFEVNKLQEFVDLIDDHSLDVDDNFDTSIQNYIKPYFENPTYWQYNGKPIMLLGGSEKAVLFNYSGKTDQLASYTIRGDRLPESVEEHLQRLSDHGGNYVRNTMSWLNPTLGNVYPYLKNENDLFDLKKSNPEFWERFERFLKKAYDLDIIVQIELFDPFDYYRDSVEWPEFGWSKNPFNPKNNVNYNSEDSGLPTEVTVWTRKYEHPIFKTAPGMVNYKNGIVLDYQKSFIDTMLEISLKYPNVLYTIYNEGLEPYQPKQFGDYWSSYIREKAQSKGVPVFIGLMLFERNLMHQTFVDTYEDNKNYAFIDISQNNRIHSQGEQFHWTNIMNSRSYMQSKSKLRPLNSVKIYGHGVSDTSSKDYNGAHGWTGGTKDAVDRHFRNILGGVSSSRFHRYGAGLGLTVNAEYVIRSSRMFVDSIDIFKCEPDSSFSLFENRSANQVYACSTGKDYGLYVAGRGSFNIRLQVGRYKLRWLDVMNSSWTDTTIINVESSSLLVTLTPPGVIYGGILILDQ